MTDIVEQLRDGAESDWAKRTRLDIWAAFTKFVDFGQKREWNATDVLIEAADEIERLRGLLREAFDHAYGNDSEEWLVRVEAALGDKP